MNSKHTNKNNFEFQDSLGELILKYCETIEFGVLCFVSSYSLLEKLLSRWKSTDTWSKFKKIKKVIVGEYFILLEKKIDLI